MAGGRAGFSRAVNAAMSNSGGMGQVEQGWLLCRETTGWRAVLGRPC